MHSLGGRAGRERGPTPTQEQCRSHQIPPARGAGGRPGKLGAQAGDARSVNRASEGPGETGYLELQEWDLWTTDCPGNPTRAATRAAATCGYLGLSPLSSTGNSAPQLHRPRVGGSAASCGCWLLCQAVKMQAVLQDGPGHDPSPGKIPTITEKRGHCIRSPWPSTPAPPEPGALGLHHHSVPRALPLDTVDIRTGSFSGVGPSWALQGVERRPWPPLTPYQEHPQS